MIAGLDVVVMDSAGQPAADCDVCGSEIEAEGGLTVRLGCFFTGCCAGRPTLSRFGIRSSDRRVVARRIPTRRRCGVLAALVVYVIVRQGLLRLRQETRAFSWRRSDAARAVKP